MHNFTKLNRAEMKKVMGATMPEDCTNACQTDGSVKCSNGLICKSVKCPKDPNFYHNVCEQSNS